MRKVLALALVAGLAVSTAFAFTGCAKKESTESTTSEQTQPMEQTDTTATMDTTAHDSM